MSELKVSLHPQQLEVFKNPARFKVVVAGRRWGKSVLARDMMLIEAVKSAAADVYYIAPTLDQGKRIMWAMLKQAGRYGKQDPIIVNAHENTSVVKLINGRQIHICGSDRPDTIRGVPMAYAVLDEYASMKPFVWEEIIRPALMDTRGGALFIGTPAGKNHFYDLYMRAGKSKDWATFQYKSMNNPFLDKEEIESAFSGLSSQIARQELDARFETFSSGLFHEDWIKFGPEPEEGVWYVAVDLAGFEAVAKERGSSGGKLDETAIVAVKVHPQGWYIGEIEHGRWNIRETSVRILRMVQEKRAATLGIEKGALMNAIMPYMQDQMQKVGFFPRIEPTTHGNRSKTDRVVWSLQGRFERGSVTLREADWNKPFIEQLLDFPNPQSHDDLVDAASYIDQIAISGFSNDYEEEEYQPFDLISGY